MYFTIIFNIDIDECEIPDFMLRLKNLVTTIKNPSYNFSSDHIIQRPLNDLFILYPLKIGL